MKLFSLTHLLIPFSLSAFTSFAQNFAEICRMPSKTGNCREKLPHWFFNDKTKKCEQFIFSGCNGNSNRFGNEVDCIRLCTGEKLLAMAVEENELSVDQFEAPRPPPEPTVDCTAQIDRGTSCTNGSSGDAVQNRWYFSYSRFRCMPFKFHGCNGNTNNFATEEECSSRCRPMDGPVCLGGQDTMAVGPYCRANDSSCPDTHVCKYGRFSVVCCDKKTEKDTECPDGGRVHMFPKNLYYLGDSCDDLQCPSGFECHKGNLFARCCPKLKKSPNLTQETHSTADQ